MLLHIRCLLLCFFMLTCAACHAPSVNQTDRVRIKLSKDSEQVCVSGLDYATLQQLKNDTLSLESWQALFPVYRMPADTNLKDDQPEQPGNYHVTDSLLTFKPDTLFVKGQLYFARFYGNGSNYSTSNLIRSRTNLKGQNFTEVLFKF